MTTVLNDLLIYLAGGGHLWLRQTVGSRMRITFLGEISADNIRYYRKKMLYLILCVSRAETVKKIRRCCDNGTKGSYVFHFCISQYSIVICLFCYL